MKAIISSLQQGKFELEKEFILGNNFFSLSWDLFLESSSSYSLSITNNSFSLIWSNSPNLCHLPIQESELNLNSWNSFKLIYIPSIGILYYKNRTLINTFKLELIEDFYKIRITLEENSKMRNLLLSPINNFDKLILHFNDSNLDDNWSVSGNLSVEQSNNSHFGKCIRIYPGSEISNINSSGITLNKSDFTLDFYIQSNSSLSCNINLFNKFKKSKSNLINLEFSNKKLVSLSLKNNNLILNSSISKVTHIALVYYHKLSTICLFVDGILELSSEFSLDKENNYFLSISSSGTFCLDEFHICSGLALWKDDFILPKYPYSDSIKLGRIFIPNNIDCNFISNSEINYLIKSKFSKIDKFNILIETIWKSEQIESNEFNPFIKNIFTVDSNNYFSHKSDLLELAESGISSCKRYLNNLLGKIDLPNDISINYTNKQNYSLFIFVKFNRKIINQEIQFIEFQISYKLNQKIIVFKECNFEITSKNYKNYYSELLELVDSELSSCKSYLDSISKNKLHLSNSESILINNSNSFILEDNPNIKFKSNNKILRLNLKKKLN